MMTPYFIDVFSGCGYAVEKIYILRRNKSG